MSRRRLIIIGAGGHGKVVADIAELVGYTDIAFLDDHPNDSLRVVGPIEHIKRYVSDADFFVAIGNPAVRAHMFERLRSVGATIINLIHPHATVARSAVLGQGILVAAGAVVGVDTVVQDGVIVNTCASIDHDGVLEAFSHVAVGAHLAGTVRVGVFTLIGAGATVINNIDICEQCTVGAGACVVKDITTAGTYLGVPAKKK